MPYTFNSDLSLMMVAHWHIAGQSWAEIATKVNKPAHELEELPVRYADQWLAALTPMMAVAQQEATLKAIHQIQVTMAATTEPKALAALVTALTRLLKTSPMKQHEAPTHAPPKPEPVPVPSATATPIPRPMETVEKQTAIQEKLSSDDLTRYYRLRNQFTDFGLFLQELPTREPAIYRKLRANNLLPDFAATSNQPLG